MSILARFTPLLPFSLASQRALLVLCFVLVAGRVPCKSQSQIPAAPADQKKALEQRLEQLEQELASLRAQINGMPQQTAEPAGSQNAGSRKETPHAPGTVPGSILPNASAVNPDAVAEQTAGERLPSSAELKGHRFFERKPGKSLTFYTGKGELTVYGNLDVSFEGSTKGIAHLLGPDGLPPVGNMGWLPDISTNLSYVGVRGTQASGMGSLDFVYQLETQIDISATSGALESNSSQDNAVKGALTSRNSYIGLGSRKIGALVFGKTDAP